MSHRSRRRIVIWTLSLLAVVVAGRANAPIAGVLATDPGPRGGSPAAGGPLSGLMQKDLDLFHAGQESIQEIDSVTGSVPDTGSGLGSTWTAAADATTFPRRVDRARPSTRRWPSPRSRAPPTRFPSSSR